MRRLRSSTVVLGGMGVLAATITSCGSEPDRRCVDTTTRELLPSYECDGGSSGSSGSTYRGAYYYGGSVEKQVPLGRNAVTDVATGGSFDKQAVDTGGFGCSSSGSGGG
ncbi:hypothetical protein AB0G79_05550 [Streptomyces sp. NPDC020807]|uniref:hypothetical protein n=1 Tax=Streptomyces sp. NPDC020807 TaxID=3155119 RepID=UPI0033F110CC